MTKKLDDLIDVEVRDGIPARFRWRERIFVIQQIVMYWIDVEPWWQHDFEHDVTWHIWRVEAHSASQNVLLDVAYRDSLLSGNAFPWRIVRVFD
ncbi:MAG: DUF6504 family protein [Candidatus Nanopelagicales bacterium]